MSASTKKKLRKELVSAQLTEKQLAEQKEAKQLKTYTTVFTAAIAVILVVAIVVAAFSLISSSGILPRTTKAVTFGSHELTSTQLNYFFVDAVTEQYNDWKESYGSMLALGMASAGLTPGKPLNTLQYPYAEDMTWADYFADIAISDAEKAYALYDAAVAAGHTMTDDEKSNLDILTQMITYYAAAGGYSNSNEYLKASYGNGADTDSYEEYMTVLALGNSYATKHFSELVYTDEQLADFNKENSLDYNSYTYSQFYVDRDDFLLCTDADNDAHVHTAEEYAPALQEAEKYAKQLAASKATNGSALNTAIAEIEAYKKAGLTCNSYTDRLLGMIKEEEQQEGLTNWLSDSSRKVGDMGYIPIKASSTSEEIDGYLVLLFEGVKENNNNLVNVRHILVEVSETAAQEDLDAAKQKLEDLKAQWLENGGTEDAFVALVKDNSTDSGSKENGGLYENVYPGQMVTAFNDWCFDESRKAGDCEIVQSSYGYHLMYFVGNSETTFRNYMIENTLRNRDYTAWQTSLVEALNSTVHTIEHLSLNMSLSAS